MDTLTWQELEDIDRQARLACPQQLRLWAKQIRGLRHQLGGDQAEYADALLLKVDHCDRIQRLDAQVDAPCSQGWMHFDFLMTSP